MQPDDSPASVAATKRLADDASTIRPSAPVPDLCPALRRYLHLASRQ